MMIRAVSNLNPLPSRARSGLPPAPPLREEVDYGHGAEGEVEKGDDDEPGLHWVEMIRVRLFWSDGLTTS